MFRAVVSNGSVAGEAPTSPRWPWLANWSCVLAPAHPGGPRVRPALSGPGVDPTPRAHRRSPDRNGYHNPVRTLATLELRWRAGISELVDIRGLPEDRRRSKAEGLRRILGAYLYRSATSFVDLSQPTRKRFIHAPEAGNKLIPWHEASYHLDDGGRLFRETEEVLELEANFAPAWLIFQGRVSTGAHSTTRTRSRPRSSRRRVRGVASHNHPGVRGAPPGSVGALAIAGRFPRSDGAIVPLARAAVVGSGPVAESIPLADLSGRLVPFTVKAFFNQRTSS